MIKNTQESYGSALKLFHWGMFALILVAIAAIFIGGDLPKAHPDKGFYYMLHKSCGVTVLGLVVLRLIWRFSNVVPDPVPGLNKIQTFSARFVHFGLYAVMILMPFSGLAFTNYPVNYFKIYQIQDFLMLGKAAKTSAHNFHHNFAWFAGGLIALHIIAALYHHYVRKDKTLRRML